jgi:hypothetical protein
MQHPFFLCPTCDVPGCASPTLFVLGVVRSLALAPVDGNEETTCPGTTHHLSVPLPPRPEPACEDAESHPGFACPQCDAPGSVSLHLLFSWCRTASCMAVPRLHHAHPQCVCVECPRNKARKPMKRVHVLERHQKTHHQSVLPTPQPMQAPIEMEVNEDDHDGPPPAVAPIGECALDALLESLADDVDCNNRVGINFSMLFRNRLTVPPHIGAVDHKGVSTQAEKNTQCFEREHQRPGFWGGHPQPSPSRAMAPSSKPMRCLQETGCLVSLISGSSALLCLVL